MKIKLLIAVLTTATLLTACGKASPTESVISTEDTIHQETTASTELEQITSTELEAIGDISVDSGLFNVELNIPADIIGETTQEKLDETAKEKGYKSITLNPDGSATYVMTKTQHKEMMDELAVSMDESLQEMIGSEDYPNFTKIEHNEDFTEFTITTASTELDIKESFSVLMFYMQGGMYNIFNGTPVDNVSVTFVNAETGAVISQSSSADTE